VGAALLDLLIHGNPHATINVAWGDVDN